MPRSPSTCPGLDFLQGGGEMGERIRGFDWSKTAIGAPENWSPALRTTIRILLANRFPMLLWWGPEYISIYNDAYRPVLGRKHPWGLGQPVRDCWSEIWDVLKPLIDTPFGGGPATWIEDIELQINRAGFTEETHFTVAYSPVPDEDASGGIGGVLATVHEISEKVVGERRVRILRDLGTRTAEAKTAEEACKMAATTLAPHAKDVSFGLLYLTDESGKKARLAASCGVLPQDNLSPLDIDLNEAVDGTWPLSLVQRTGQMKVVEELSSKFVAVPRGSWPDPPNRAMVVPIPSRLRHQFSGFLVAGLSSRLALDDGYKNFLELATSQIATAIANAKAYEEERKRAEALAELDRAKTLFFSNVSHEFRTPLTLMLGPIEEMLKEATGLPALHQERLSIAHRNSLRLLRLVNSLLDFSRIEAGRMKAFFEPVNLATLTSDLASNFRSIMQAAGLELVMECPPLPEPVYVDRDMWEKIVLNLLSNAFKFTFTGRVTVRMEAAANRAVLTVADTGTGIPEAELPHIFERFHRVEGATGRTYEGTGIGLALIQELVKLHGGTIEARSRLGEGSAFSVSLPFGAAHLPQERIRTNPADTVANSTLRAASFTSEAMTWLTQHKLGHPSEDYLVDPRPKAGTRERILLADDNADMREHITHILDGEYEVLALHDGNEALNAAREKRPDLIVSDVMMPGLDGFGLLRELRNDPQLREIPVILLSARAGEEARTEGIIAGADDYVTKPFSTKELLARVRTILNLQRVRRAADAERQIRAAQFETLLNQAPLGAYLVDADFRIQQVNPSARPFFGDIADLVGRDFDELVHVLWTKEYADQIVSLFRHTLETGKPYMTSGRIGGRIDRDANEYYEWRIDRIPLPDGRFGVVCYFRDISAQVQAREAVETLNSLLTSDLAAMTRMQQLSTRLVGTNELHILLGDILEAAIEITRAHKGNIQFFEGGVLRIVQQHGFEAPFLDFFNSVAHSTAACETAMQRGERVIVEDIASSPIFSGTPALDVMLAAGVRAVQSTPLISRSGRLVGMLSTHYSTPQTPAERDLRMLDLLARQAADCIERHLKDEALRASEERLRLAAQAARFGTYDADLVANSVYWSPGLRDILGVPDNVQPPAPAVVPSFIHPDDAGQVQEMFSRVFDPAGDGVVLDEHRIVRPDGSIRWVQVRGQVQFTGEGELRRAIRNSGVLLDITDRKRDDERLQQAQKLESVGLLAGGIAHDFNNLLTGIMGNASLVLDDIPPGPAERIKDVLAAAERAAHLTRQLLAYSGKGQFILRDLDVSQAVQEISDLVQLSIPKSVQLSLTVEKRLPVVRMDPGQLQQILMNLVINAGEAVGEGIPGRITVATSTRDVATDFVDATGEQVEAGRYVCVEISDTGSGISEDAKRKIFDPFFTTKFTGRGLGLAAVAGILRSQKGGILVESMPGSGSTFRVFLPAAEARARGLELQPDANVRATVLVADDERSVRDFIGASLRKHRFRVLTASDGREALALCERRDEKIDAAILDIVMPRMGANELLPAVKALQPNMKILLTSGYSETEARRLCNAYPGADFIEKPYTARQILEALEKLLQVPHVGEH